LSLARGNMKFAARAARILGVVVIAYLVLGGVCLWYCVAMPGRSFRGAPPQLSAAERAAADALRAHVAELAVRIGPRRAPLRDTLHRAEAYITQQLMAAAPTARVQREPLLGAPDDAANVVLDLPGSAPGPLVIIGAHYDSAPAVSPGANDNASGSAAALVLAARFATLPHRLPLRFVLFANEEPPYFQTDLMGSYQHARGCQQRGERVRAMISLETMGYYSEQPGSQQYPPPLAWVYPDRGDFLAIVGNLESRALVHEVIRNFRERAKLPSEAAALPAIVPGVGWSDHWAFWQFDYPAVMVTDTAVFRDPHYHEATDVIDNLDFERLAWAVSGMQFVIEQLVAAEP
jgi:hypothetical protein